MTGGRPTYLCALLILTLAFSTATAKSPAAVTFPSLDGLEITADLYLAAADPAPSFIVLFHEANSSRGEYRDIALASTPSVITSWPPTSARAAVPMTSRMKPLSAPSPQS